MSVADEREAILEEPPPTEADAAPSLELDDIMRDLKNRCELQS